MLDVVASLFCMPLLFGMRPRSAAPILGDGDREVVREQGSPNKCVQKSAQEQQRHHGRGHERQAQRQALAEGARNLLRVPDAGDGSRRHRERVCPPRYREPSLQRMMSLCYDRG